MTYIRAKLSFSLIRSALLFSRCSRSSKDKNCATFSEPGLNIPIAECKLKYIAMFERKLTFYKIHFFCCKFLNSFSYCIN